MSPEHLASIVKAGAELAQYVEREAARPANRRRWRQLEQMLSLLRSIYFAPGGTRLILEQIADENPLNPEVVSEILTNFNDFEYFGMREMPSLGFERTGSMDLSLSARETLHRLQHGKGGVRRAIQEVLNYALTADDKQIEPETARQLLHEIEALNRLIQSAEESIIARMKSELS